MGRRRRSGVGMVGLDVLLARFGWGIAIFFNNAKYIVRRMRLCGPTATDEVTLPCGRETSAHRRLVEFSGLACRRLTFSST